MIPDACISATYTSPVAVFTKTPYGAINAPPIATGAPLPLGITLTVPLPAWPELQKKTSQGAAWMNRMALGARIARAIGKKHKAVGGAE